MPKKNITLNNLERIAQWCEENGRIPRQSINDIKTARNREKKTPEQTELRLGQAFNNIKTNYLKKYNGIPLENIDDETDRGIVMLGRDIKEKYKNRNKNKENVKQKKLTLNNLEKIAQWCEENGRIPAQAIKGIKATKNREEETPKQTETRLGRALNSVNSNYLKKYTDLPLENIDDEIDREIVNLGRGIKEKYGNKRKNSTYAYEDEDVKTSISSKLDNYDKIKLAQMIVGLIKSRHATLEQIQVMADYYDVDLEDTLNSLETRSFEDSEIR